ncbi:transcription factor bHLH147-like [Zingiber officinale]|uniref:transcription factor bHLH147-like n=1 Tax=Zingiber officinale TaxID=94328 RepID=UPI001C4C1385|nr:transcription factor bHLH147-like [Zingiber officinale]
MADGKPAEMESGGERKRKRGVEASSSSSSSSSSSAVAKWRTEGEQRNYSSKLIAALRRVRSATPSPAGSRAVREAADRALAVAARGRTRWSRAILLSSKIPSLKRSRLLLRRRATFRPKPFAAAGRSSRPPALEKKTRVLGRLVPGCRKLPLPSLLEEVSDYIAALQMQVRAMSAFAQILSATSDTAGTPSPPPPPPPPPM